MLVVVDLSNHIHRVFHGAPPLRTSSGVPTGAVFGIARMVLDLKDRFQPSHLVFAGEGGSSFRKAMYSQYKADREPPPPDLIAQFPLVEDMLKAMSVPVLRARGFEADDVMATLALTAAANGLDALIVSGDKDMTQVVGEHHGRKVAVYDVRKAQMVGPAQVEERLGVAPHLVGDLLALAGDSSDNVPGCPGVGMKTAAKLIQAHGGMREVLAAAPTMKGSRGRVLTQHAQDVLLSRELVRLRRAPFPDDVLESLRVREPDPEVLREACLRFEFRSLEPPAWEGP